MPPLTKTCPKMVLSHKGGCLCVKDVFAKKFSGAGEDSAVGALASVLRKHFIEGRTPDAVGRCCVRHCAPRRTGTCHLASERFTFVLRTRRPLCGRLSVRQTRREAKSPCPAGSAGSSRCSAARRWQHDRSRHARRAT